MAWAFVCVCLVAGLGGGWWVVVIWWLFALYLPCAFPVSSPHVFCLFCFFHLPPSSLSSGGYRRYFNILIDDGRSHHHQYRTARRILPGMARCAALPLWRRTTIYRTAFICSMASLTRVHRTTARLLPLHTTPPLLHLSLLRTLPPLPFAATPRATAPHLLLPRNTPYARAPPRLPHTVLRFNARKRAAPSAYRHMLPTRVRALFSRAAAFVGTSSRRAFCARALAWRDMPARARMRLPRAPWRHAART